MLRGKKSCPGVDESLKTLGTSRNVNFYNGQRFMLPTASLRVSSTRFLTQTRVAEQAANHRAPFTLCCDVIVHRRRCNQGNSKNFRLTSAEY